MKLFASRRTARKWRKNDRPLTVALGRPIQLTGHQSDALPAPPSSPLKFLSVLQASHHLLCQDANKKTPIGQSRADGITMPKWPRFQMKES
ncbi:hypothetical protein EVAR_65178_1 [Eumeta japonica]|uniref:Uncharacterized protein n=1 Tax=Eumeta variegata TaxID=151549 RepID=A0A4C1ZLR7_EUMVA|nr:hypothetical protein EVAR_65178_1 [Eumeta japonica]